MVERERSSDERKASHAKMAAHVLEERFSFSFSDHAKQLYDRVKSFVEQRIKPNEAQWQAELDANRAAGNPWKPIAIAEQLKQEARAQGLWNLFLTGEAESSSRTGAGLTCVEYAPIAELMGGNAWTAEVFNCSAPDTGNMEVLHRFGSASQKKQWLEPLLAGKIRSAFCMTEPAVASSDATNMALSIAKCADGGYELNGRKWWISGVMDPRCELLIVMGRVDDADDQPLHKQHSMVLVSRHTKGVTVESHLTVFGYDDAPHGHGVVNFDRVKVDANALVLGEGRGFEIAQGRLGPGRIHHCMRAIGLAERCLQLMCERAASREAFGSELARKDLVRAAVAESRMEITQARLLTMHAARLIDTRGGKGARQAIAMIKVVAARVACAVADRAIQAHGGAGVCQTTPLAQAYAAARTLRLADGPDEVHLLQVGKIELAPALRARL